MSSWRAFCHTVHLASLGIWAGAGAIAVATAAVAFPTLKALKVQVPGIAPGFEDEHFRFAAGAVAQRVFLVGDIVSFACAMLAALSLFTLVGIFRIPVKRPATIVRSLALSIAIASLAAMLLIVTPRINAASTLHLAAAKAGDAGAAAMHRASVDELHPIASDLIFAELVGVLIALVAGAWSLATAPEPDRATMTSAYPLPELLRRKSS